MTLLYTLLATSHDLQAHALLFARVFMGLLFIKHGYLKIVGGMPEWIWTGEQMKNLGITFWPLFWGLAATFAEFGGGIMLVLGFGTRIAAALLIFTMFVAVIHHICNNDPWGYISFPLSQMVIFIAFFIAGGGLYSLDNYILSYLTNHQ